MSHSTLMVLVKRFQSLPALRAKCSIGLVADILGSTDWVHGPGDDAAIVNVGNQQILVAGEAIWPPFVASDPYGAGVAAVVANVNDVAAMGGRSLALVNHVVASKEHAREVLRGIRFAAGLYGLPVVGGHLTIWDGSPSASASIIGRVDTPLASVHVSDGQDLLLACCLEGTLRSDYPFFTSIHERGGRLAADVDILPQLADEELVAAAKDVSMPGILGSMAMLLEPTGSGAVVDLGALPKPPDVPLADWSFVFPTFAFLLCAPSTKTASVIGRFQDAGLACELVGSIDDSGVLRASLEGNEVKLLDLKSQTVTGFKRGR